MTITKTIFLCIVLVLMDGYLQHVLAQNCISDIQELPFAIYIEENTPADTILANITTHDDILYTFDKPEENNFIAFGIRNQTIVARMDIDLDGPNNTEICKKAPQLQEPAKISCKNEGGDVKVVNFIVTFTDDYTPRFTASETSVNESAPVGTVVFQLDAIVIDEDCTNEFSFIILDNVSINFFQVDNSKQQLLLKRSLDYELQTVHNISLQVTSTVRGGYSYEKNTTTLTVHVNDSDDMSPIFDISQFVVHIPEEQNVSSIWYTSKPPIMARDGDVGINTKLVYSVESVPPGLRLEIHNETGEVRVLDILDRETVSSYRVIVKAAQADVTYRTATATLSVLVDDVNDNRPRYTSLTNITVMEDTLNGTTVLELTGQDDDEGINSEFSFTIESIESSDIAAFNITRAPGTNRTYLVVTKSTALRGQSLAHVQIRLVETQPLFSGSSPCDVNSRCVVEVTINITDVNDNTPEFLAANYTFTLSSNASGHVGQVEATDKDKGDNAKIEYSLKFITGPVDCSNLILNSTTGELTTSTRLPEGVVCSWIVTACDSPADVTLRRCGSVFMSVRVLPSGGIVEQDFHVPENVPIGTVITPIYIPGLHTMSTDFEINNDMLCTKINLDREKIDLYEVRVLSGQDVNSTVMIIHVQIDDVNDNPPVFDNPHYVLRLLNDTKQLNQVVLRVNASDEDIGNNSRLAFSLTNGNGFFDIDAETGEIRLTNFPPRDTDFQLLVTDFGHPPLKGLSRLSVFTPLHNETATVILPRGKNELMADRDGVADKLSKVLGVIVTILAIESLGPVPEAGSKLYIQATTAAGVPVSPTELAQLLEQHAVEVYEKFAKSDPHIETIEPDKLSVLEIVLISVGGVLLLAVLLFVTLWCRGQSKYKRSKRLFDSLNRNTSMYDNPRKPSNTSAAAITNNDESENARRMLARLSNGSVGHSSVTNLIPKTESGSNSGNTTPFSGEHPEHEQDGNDYVNLDHLDGTSPHLQAGNHSDNVVHEVTGNVLLNHHGNDFQEAGPHSRTHDTTPGSARLNNISSIDDEDVGMTSGNKGSHFEVVDENDQEVAHILSDSVPTDIDLPSTDEINNTSNLDLMTSLTQPVLQENVLNSIYNNVPATSNQDSLDLDILPEPEPDYAKKVRFSDTTTTAVNNEETLDAPDDNDRNTSLGQFLSEHGGIGNTEDDTGAFHNTIEELTAL